jgi:hypothetical protein
MDSNGGNWASWRDFFEHRSGRPLPNLRADTDYSGFPASLAKSLAIFQLGESGGGSVIEQARRDDSTGTGSEYADAMALFVNEEHRHANILAMCVRLLGGTVIRKNWTASLFVSVRRLIGLRVKVCVLLAAEVVGICYYHLLASRMPDCQVRSCLLQMVEDERSHLYFHCDFLRVQANNRWRRLVFVCGWRTLMVFAAVAVLIDHRQAIRDSGLEFRTVCERWMAFSKLAERLVMDRGATVRDFRPPLLSPNLTRCCDPQPGK